MTGDLIEHVVKKRHAGVNGLTASAVKINDNPDLGFFGIAGNVSGSHIHTH
jgi:hypothetical protein